MTITTFTATALPAKAWVALVVYSDGSDEVTITRRPQGPGTDASVRGAKQVTITSAASPVVIYDTEVPLWQQVTYTLTYAGGQMQASTRLDGPWSVSGVEAHAWLRHIARPGLSRPVIVTEFSATTRTANAGVHRPLNSSLPVVVTGPRSSREGGFRLVTFATDEAVSMRQLLDTSTLLLTTHPQRGVAKDGLYLFAPDITEARIGRTSSERLWTVPFIEVDVPIEVGFRDIGPKYDDLLTHYPTYKDMTDEATRGVTYDDFLVSIPPP